jgi:anti-anti-sigma regulatory factor/HAMP domain-containing protein
MDAPSYAPNGTAAIPLWRQFRWQLILAFVLLAVVPLVLVAAVTNTLSRRQAQAQIFRQLESIADLKRDQITGWINDSTAALNVFVSDPVRDQLIAFASVPAPAPNQQAQIDALLSQATTQSGTTARGTVHFRGLFLYTPDGHVVASSDAAQVGRVVARQPYFQPSLTSDHVQPPSYAIGSNELIMVITHRLADANGQTRAVVGAQLDLTILGQVMLGRSGLGVSGETYLVSQESQYLLTPSRFEGYSLTQAYHSAGIDRALHGENGTGSYTNYRNPPVEVMGVYRWVPELQAALLAETATSEALAAAEQAQQISIALMLGASLVALLVGLLVATKLTRPITALTQVAARITNGDLDQRADVGQRNEMGVLAAGFNTMTTQLQQNLQGLEQRVAERTAALQEAIDEREQSLVELRESIRARETLQQTIQALSSPVLPVLEGILVMPLIGVIDSERATLLVTSLLAAIEHQHATSVILDVTGVPLVDTQIARVLLQAADATRLLGAEPILVGIRPELAQTIVGLGLDLSALMTQADLASGIRYAAQRQKLHAQRWLTTIGY